MKLSTDFLGMASKYSELVSDSESASTVQLSSVAPRNQSTSCKTRCFWLKLFSIVQTTCAILITIIFFIMWIAHDARFHPVLIGFKVVLALLLVTCVLSVLNSYNIVRHPNGRRCVNMTYFVLAIIVSVISWFQVLAYLYAVVNGAYIDWTSSNVLLLLASFVPWLAIAVSMVASTCLICSQWPCCCCGATDESQPTTVVVYLSDGNRPENEAQSYSAASNGVESETGSAK